eukprot:TRINITY_DN4957_c0_g2_i2.p1 TRINITY_DN4957_c0_g2~~TRINITY_DN4957_c0_g2_i2.p1  ORF type:complete len:547 (+),score=28.42 TRINITY_DN4957_c0_g2_i2:121-1641(+)
MEGISCEILVPTTETETYTGNEVTECSEKRFEEGIVKITGKGQGSGTSYSFLHLSIGWVLCQPKIKLGDLFVIGMCLTAGHALLKKPTDQVWVKLNGIKFQARPLFHYHYCMLRVPSDPITGHKLSCGIDFAAFLILSNKSEDRKLLSPLPILANPLSENNETKVVAYFPTYLNAELFAPWADKTTKDLIETDMNKLCDSLCCSKGRVLKLGDAVFATDNSTVGGFSGGPCLVDGAVCGLLYGGPTCEGHWETNVLATTLEATNNKEDVITNIMYKLWKATRKKYHFELALQPEEVWGCESKAAILIKLKQMYYELMPEFYGNGVLKEKHNNFTAIHGPEITTFLKCVTQFIYSESFVGKNIDFYKKLDSSVPYSEPKDFVEFKDMDEVRKKYFGQFLSRNLVIDVSIKEDWDELNVIVKYKKQNKYSAEVIYREKTSNLLFSKKEKVYRSQPYPIEMGMFSNKGKSKNNRLGRTNRDKRGEDRGGQKKGFYYQADKNIPRVLETV